MPTAVEYSIIGAMQQPKEIFKFLNIRGPVAKLPSPTHISYTSLSGTLYTALVAIKTTAAPTWKDQVKDAALDFKSTSGYANIYQVEDDLPNLFAINNYFATGGALPGAGVSSWLSTEYGITASTYASDNDTAIDNLWDNLFAEAIVPMPGGFGDYLAMALRTVNLITLAGAGSPLVSTVEGVNSILNGDILLPDTLFPISYVEISTPDTVTPPDAPDDSDFILHNHLVEGVKELDAYLNRKMSILRTSLPTEVPFDPTDVDDATWLSYRSSVDTIHSNFKTLMKYTSGDESNIGSNFTTAITAMGISSHTGMNVFDLRNTMLAKAKELLGNTVPAGISEGQKVVRIGNNIYTDPGVTEDAEAEAFTLIELLNCKLYPLGVGDFLKVKETLHGYVPGEIAHVENVMMGEERSRETKSLDREEVTIMEEHDITTQTEKDLQTTDRYEQLVNSSKAVQSSFSASAGINVSGKYGLTTVDASANASYNTNTSSALNTATTTAKEITETSRQLTIDTVKTQRTTTIIHQFKEHNKHSFKNESDVNQTGVYRWLDKQVYNQIYNYGPHLMYEFIVPEPAFFHIFAKMMNANQAKDVALVKPIAPDDVYYWNQKQKSALTDFTKINESNYAFWAAFYGAKVDAPPQKSVTVSGSVYTSKGTGTVSDVTIPPGYAATSATAQMNWWNKATWLLIGGTAAFGPQAGGSPQALHPIEGKVGMSYMSESGPFDASYDILCTCKQEVIDKWKAETYMAIMAAYQQQLNDFNQALKNMQQEAATETNFGINPAFNRETEMKELKKACIEMLTLTYLNSINSVKYPSVTNNPCTQPEIAFCEANLNGKWIKFFEDAFEWDQLIYNFYDYYWGKKCKWVEMYNREDADPLFRKFLQAGAARVIVPVTPGYEKVIMYFQETGIRWYGKNPPVLTDPKHISLAAEVDAIPAGGTYPVKYGDAWTVSLPTDLVVMQCESGCVSNTLYNPELLTMLPLIIDPKEPIDSGIPES